MAKKFRKWKRAKPIYEKSVDGKPALKSTLRRISCYRCGFSGGTLIKHSVGYCHQDPKKCIENIKRVKLWEKFERAKKKILRRQKRIDIRILNWFQKIWRKIWNFFKYGKRR